MCCCVKTPCSWPCTAASEAHQPTRLSLHCCSCWACPSLCGDVCLELVQLAVLAAQVVEEGLWLQGVAGHCCHQGVTRHVQGAQGVDVLV